MRTSRLGYLCALGAALAVASASPSFAATDLITNGTFDMAGGEPTTSQQITTSNLTGWSTSGYNFIYLADSTSASGSTADTTGASGSAGNVKLWGPGDGSNNGFTTSPSGKNFIAADDNYGQGAITQSVSGLQIGQTYALRFYWAGAQQQGFTGTTQEQWTVTFGNQTQATDTITLASMAFSGWKAVTMYFTATATTQTLSFLATGSPGGAPPFSLLDGVSLMVPEPGTWAVLVSAILGMGAFTWFRRRGNSPTGGAQA